MLSNFRLSWGYRGFRRRSAAVKQKGAFSNRVAPRLEVLESRIALDGSGFPGNDCAPNLDLSAVPVQEITVGQTLAFNLYSAGASVEDLDLNSNPTGDAIRLVLDPDIGTDTPAGATLAENGDFSWTPTASDLGMHQLIVIAIDEGTPALADVEVFFVRVRGANHPPDLAPIPDRTATVGVELVIDVTASDPNAGDTLTFHLDVNDSPSNAQLQQTSNTTARIRWTPEASDLPGPVSFRVLVTDDGDPELVDSQSFVVTLNSAANSAPSFVISSTSLELAEDSGEHNVPGFLTSISPGAANESGQVVSFQVENDNPSLFAVAPFIDSTGLLSFTLADNANGSSTVEVTAMDDGGTENGGVDTSAPQSFVITVDAVNDAPFFAIAGNPPAVNEDVPLQTVANFITSVSPGPGNESGQTVEIQVTSISNPNLFAMQQPPTIVNGELRYTPAENASGTAIITIRAVDDGGVDGGGQDASDPIQFTITVNPLNDPPTAIALSNSQVPEGSPNNALVGFLTVSDVDAGDQHTFEFVDNGTVQNADGRFLIVGNELRIADSSRLAENDNYSVSIRATETGPEPLFVEMTFSISVTAADGARALIIGDVTVNSALESTAEVPVSVSQTDGIQAIDLLINYNTSLLDLYNPGQRPGGQPESIRVQSALTGWSLDWQVDDTTGTLIVSIFSASPLLASTSLTGLLTLEFDVVDGATGSATVAFVTSSGTHFTELNEGQIEALLDDGTITVL